MNKGEFVVVIDSFFLKRQTLLNSIAIIDDVNLVYIYLYSNIIYKYYLINYSKY